MRGSNSFSNFRNPSFQNNHILNVDLMYHLCVNNIPGIIFIKINTDDVQNHYQKTFFGRKLFIC